MNGNTNGNGYPHSHSQSPPLPSLQSLSISPYPHPTGSSPDYRYNGVFGPPNGQSNGVGGWSSPDKRGSRSGIPTVSLCLAWVYWDDPRVYGEVDGIVMVGISIDVTTYSSDWIWWYIRPLHLCFQSWLQLYFRSAPFSPSILSSGLLGPSVPHRHPLTPAELVRPPVTRIIKPL